MNTSYSIQWYLLLIMLIPACGTNMYESQDKADPAEAATRALEEDNPDEAIKILDRALADDPENYQLISIKSAAVAQKYGVDTLSLALKLADKKSKKKGNGITSTFSALPKATNANIAGVGEAVDLMESIPENDRTDADNFKLSMLLTAHMGLLSKKFDSDGSGGFSPQELANMSDADAAKILKSLIGSEEALRNGSVEGSKSESAANQVAAMKNAIDGQEGEDDAAKLRNYLGSK